MNCIESDRLPPMEAFPMTKKSQSILARNILNWKDWLYIARFRSKYDSNSSTAISAFEI
jgi:hypothetical protein